LTTFSEDASAFEFKAREKFIGFANTKSEQKAEEKLGKTKGGENLTVRILGSKFFWKGVGHVCIHVGLLRIDLDCRVVTWGPSHVGRMRWERITG
jgi:hypothetical protein